MLLPDTSPTRQLAEFAVALSYEDLPPPVVERLKHCILDALGCTIFGITLPWTRMLIDLVAEEGGNPQARVIGTTFKTSVSQAALIGATAGHGFELDDIHGAAHLHAGSLAVPTALAVADARLRVSGRRLIAAIAAGYEVGLRVALAATGKLFMRGHHCQGACGPFVAAAAAANLLRLPSEPAHHTLGIAGSLGAGLMAAQEGAMSKRLHSGRAAQAGVTAAYLAARGFTGIPNVLEAPYGGVLRPVRGGAAAPRPTQRIGRALRNPQRRLQALCDRGERAFAALRDRRPDDREWPRGGRHCRGRDPLQHHGAPPLRLALRAHRRHRGADEPVLHRGDDDHRSRRAAGSVQRGPPRRSGRAGNDDQHQDRSRSAI